MGFTSTLDTSRSDATSFCYEIDNCILPPIPGLAEVHSGPNCDPDEEWSLDEVIVLFDSSAQPGQTIEVRLEIQLQQTGSGAIEVVEGQFDPDRGSLLQLISNSESQEGYEESTINWTAALPVADLVELAGEAVARWNGANEK